MDCSPPGSFVHGILQARILEWVAIPFSRGSSQPRDRTQVYPHCRQILYPLSHQGSPGILELVACRPPDLPDPGIELVSPALQADSLPAELPGKPSFLGNSCLNIFGLKYHDASNFFSSGSAKKKKNLLQIKPMLQKFNNRCI